MTEKYVLGVDIDHGTGEEHCTVLKTDGVYIRWRSVFDMYMDKDVLQRLAEVIILWLMTDLN